MKRIKNYELVKLVGHGHSAEVYQAINIDTGQQVAIKLLHDYLTDDYNKQPFLHEAKLLTQLKHPAIIRMLDAGIDGTRPYVVLTYAPNGNLRMHYPHNSILPASIVIDYTYQIALILDYAHHNNIIHGDIKPENILLNEHQRLLLSDFGIAQIAQHTLTQSTREPMGTAIYAAPEQLRGKAKKASDQYSLAIMVYEWLCGTPPFQGKNFNRIYDAHLHEPAPSIRARNRNITAEVEAVLLRALDKNPERRFPGALEFAQALEQAYSHHNTANPSQPGQSSTLSHQPTTSTQGSPLNMPFVRRRRSSANNDQVLPAPGTTQHLDSGPVASRRNMFVDGWSSSIREAEGKPETTTFVQPPARATRKLHNESGKRSIPHSVYTILDIGTTSVKAMIAEVKQGYANILGMGMCFPKTSNNMSDGLIMDIPGVIANCNEALLKAEQAAGDVIAPSTIIGIASELVKGGSTTISKQRVQPTEQITDEELEALITTAQERLLRMAQKRIAAETGYGNLDVRLTNSAVISVRIDGQLVTNPIGLRGRHFELTLFSAFAPLTQLGAIETVAQGLDLTLIKAVAEPYALARCLASNVDTDNGAIFIDIGGGTTDIALMRPGGIAETRVFALGGRVFTRRIATGKGISMKEAEQLKISYSNGELKGSGHDEIQAILAPECQTWMDSVELLIDELSEGELLPPAIYSVGGGSALVDLQQHLKAFPWTKWLPFPHPPTIGVVQPGMVSSILDNHGVLTGPQDITPMALAYQAVELHNETNIVERALDRVINAMHI